LRINFFASLWSLAFKTNALIEAQHFIRINTDSCMVTFEIIIKITGYVEVLQLLLLSTNRKLSMAFEVINSPQKDA
jgi:hypothetical protein